MESPADRLKRIQELANNGKRTSADSSSNSNPRTGPGTGPVAAGSGDNPAAVVIRGTGSSDSGYAGYRTAIRPPTSGTSSPGTDGNPTGTTDTNGSTVASVRGTTGANYRTIGNPNTDYNRTANPEPDSNGIDSRGNPSRGKEEGNGVLSGVNVTPQPGEPEIVSVPPAGSRSKGGRIPGSKIDPTTGKVIPPTGDYIPGSPRSAGSPRRAVPKNAGIPEPTLNLLVQSLFGLIGVALKEEHWYRTEDEVRPITEPLSRISQTWEPETIAQVQKFQDYGLLLSGIAIVTGPSITESINIRRGTVRVAPVAQTYRTVGTNGNANNTENRQETGYGPFRKGFNTAGKHQTN